MSQAVQEVFCWSRNPMEVRRLTARKEEIYRDLLGERIPLVPAGARQLIDVLGKHQVRQYHSPANLSAPMWSSCMLKALLLIVFTPTWIQNGAVSNPPWSNSLA